MLRLMQKFLFVILSMTLIYSPILVRADESESGYKPYKKTSEFINTVNHLKTMGEFIEHFKEQLSTADLQYLRKNTSEKEVVPRIYQQGDTFIMSTHKTIVTMTIVDALGKKVTINGKPVTITNLQQLSEDLNKILSPDKKVSLHSLFLNQADALWGMVAAGSAVALLVGACVKDDYEQNAADERERVQREKGDISANEKLAHKWQKEVTACQDARETDVIVRSDIIDEDSYQLNEAILQNCREKVTKLREECRKSRTYSVYRRTFDAATDCHDLRRCVEHIGKQISDKMVSYNNSKKEHKHHREVVVEREEEPSTVIRNKIIIQNNQNNAAPAQ